MIYVVGDAKHHIVCVRARAGIHNINQKKIFYRPEEAKELAEKMLGHNLVTKQTGAEGKPCNAVYICERKYARNEYYFAILLDRKSAGPVIVASSQGGVDIETVAAQTPEAIITLPIDAKVGFTKEKALDLAKQMGFTPKGQEQAAETFLGLFKLFSEKDATQVEINPLSESSDNQGKKQLVRVGRLQCINELLH